MKSDTAINEFLEKYDDNAMKSIDNFSKRYGPNIKKKKYKVFNLKECFNNFENYIKGYAKYKSDNIGNTNASPQSAISEKTYAYIEAILNGKDMEVLYRDIPSFVKSYAEGVKSLNESIEEAKHLMSVSDVDTDSIGAINEFADKFMTVITEAFDNTMEKLLWASGYRSNQILFEGKPDPRKKDEHVFL